MSFGDNVKVEFITGAGAALIDCCVFHSVDTLKVRAQDCRSLLPWDALRQASTSYRPVLALRSLYQGFSTNMVLKVPYMSAMFGFHAVNRSLLSSCDALSEAQRNFLSAMLVGVEASLLLSPLELVRIQGQNNGRGEILSALRYVLRKVGPSGMWSCGMHACMHREAKYCVGQFALIGTISAQLAARSTQNQHWLYDNPDMRSLVASVVVGLFCTVISHPDDVVKTRQQTRLALPGSKSPYSSYVSTIAHVVQTEGIATLYNGWVWRCCVRVPFGLALVNFVHPRLRPKVESALGLA